MRPASGGREDRFPAPVVAATHPAPDAGLELPEGGLSPRAMAQIAAMLDAREELNRKPETYEELGKRLGLSPSQLSGVRLNVRTESEEATREAAKLCRKSGIGDLDAMRDLPPERQWEIQQEIGEVVQGVKARHDGLYRDLGLSEPQLAALQEVRRGFSIGQGREGIAVRVTLLRDVPPR